MASSILDGRGLELRSAWIGLLAYGRPEHSRKLVTRRMHAIAQTSTIIGLGTGLATGWAMASTTGRVWVGEQLQRVRRLGHRMPFSAVSAHSIGWGRNQRHQDKVTFYMKPLFRDPRSGQSVMLVRYPAGQINPAHTHPAGHGMFVLSGSLETHRGTFGPDTFVWFPGGEIMWHGAGPDEDLIALFMVGRDLETEYVRQVLASASASRPR